MPLSSLFLRAFVPSLKGFYRTVLQEEDIDLLLHDLLTIYGYDFTFYSRDSLNRRLNRLYRLEKLESLDALRKKIKTDKDYVHHLVDKITVNVTEMFRDPGLFLELRKTVVPRLKELPEIRVWHAGCASGEEAYSLAIVLHEADLLHKTQIIATDINPLVISRAQHGSYRNSLIKIYEKNYLASGGLSNFGNYFIPGTNESRILPFITQKINFVTHNLASDTHIGQFDIILCRNVVIYFDKELREKVFRLFDTSVKPGAYLVLGEKENPGTLALSGRYAQQGGEKIWKKIH